MAQLLPGVPHQLLEDVKRIVRQYEEYIMNPVNGHNLLNCAETMFPDMKVMGSTKIQYHCDCSKEVLYPMLYSLDQDDLLAAVAKRESIELVCHICGRKYKFDVDDISNLLKTF
ncbi:Hsp33 family molecular chaperone HslO [Paenibacillus sp. cl141a]|uniref:Hsp33 family molecular chaperone HslO n=1 Tax=Paenibacillus sp. cl141a TaxID=1761877 RepID=UPI000B80DF8A